MTVQRQREMYLTDTQPYYSGSGMECVCTHACVHALAPCIPWSRSEQGVSFEMKHA